MSFDEHESMFHSVCNEYFGKPQLDLLSELDTHQDFLNIQNFIKVWKIPELDKHFKFDNYELIVFNEHNAIAWASVSYAYYMQNCNLNTNVTIIKSNNKFIVSPGASRLAFCRIMPDMKMSAYLIDLDRTPNQKIKSIFSNAEIDTQKNIVLKQGDFDGRVYWYYLNDSENPKDVKFEDQEIKEEWFSYRLEFLDRIRSYEQSLTLYHKDVMIAQISNENSELKIQIDSAEGLAQFVLEYFCGYNNFCIERQYRIME